GGTELGQLLQFLRDLNRGHTLAAVAEAVLRYAISVVPGAQTGSLLVLNDETGVFEFRAAVGWDMEKLARIRIPKDKIIQRSLFHDRPAIVRNPLALSRDQLGEELGRLLAEAGPVAVFLTLPIAQEGQVIGYLNLDNRDDPDAFSPEDFSRLELVWEEIALAVSLARKRELLAEREHLFRLLFERLADAVYITAFDGTILEANPAAFRQSGYSRDELIGLNIMRDLAAGEPAITYATANERLERGETVVFEEKKRRKDGTFYWTECAVVLFEYRGQKATLSVNRDITARKDLEEQIRERVEKLSALHKAVLRLQRCQTVDEACTMLVEDAAHILGFAVCGVDLVDGDHLVPVAISDLARGLSRPVPRGEGIGWKTLAEGKSLWGNVEAFPNARPTSPSFRSFLSVPIGDIGVFQAVASRPDAFTAEDVMLTEILAGHVREVIAHLRLAAELREQAIRDPLTGLYNRRFLSEALAQELERARRYGRPLALIMGDVDSFKAINDRYGHVAGDQVLQRVARVLQSTVRASDYVVRYGGEEFVVVLPETDEAGAEEAMARVTQALAGMPEEPRATLSLGAAVWRPGEAPAASVEDLLRRADEMLYTMKRRHRD
ncbi:diguanylate cyclase, partial [Candidatus Bipolaricaulota bacterium]|nr:diguanylate cyclase [Candidatus Bipolaricaulota bacterium]